MCFSSSLAIEGSCRISLWWMSKWKNSWSQMNFGAYITLSAFAPGQCSMDSSGQQKKQVENLQDSFIFLNPRSADFTCVKSKWIYTVQSHRDLCEVSDSNWNAICVSKHLITDNSLKIQCPVQRVHPATLFCTADISEAKIA